METKQSNNSATPMADAVKIANQRALFSLEWENDTVFKKRELNYKTKAAFQKDLEAGKISKYTTVFIKDSKEIYKNGQYYGAGSSSVVDITDIVERLKKIEDGGKVEQSDYNNLKKYTSEGKILIYNFSEKLGTTSCSLSYYCDGNDIAISANSPYATIGFAFLTLFISGNDLSFYKIVSIVPFTEYIPECNLSKKYKKSDSYTPITSSDSIEKAIGKLEAGVSSEDFILDLSKYTKKYGVKFNLNPEDLEGVKLAINNKRKILIKTDLSEDTKGAALIPVASLQNKDGIFCQYKFKMQYFVYEDTITITILTSTGECTVFYSTSSIYPSKNGDISILAAFEGPENLSAKSEIKLKKSGNGTKFLSDNGEYKEIQQGDNSKQSVYVNFNNYLSDGVNGTVNNWSTLKPLLDECCNTELDAEGDKNSGKKQLLATYYVLPFLRATMSVKNSSVYMLSFTACGCILNIEITDNGSSATYSVDIINIDSSIDSSGNGKKYLSDNGSYSEPEGHKIDITNIYKRIDALEIGAKIEKDDYDKLRKYAVNKNTLFINGLSKGCIISDIVNYIQKDGNIILKYTTYAYGAANPTAQLILISVGLDLVINNKISYPYCEAIMPEGYKKASNYSPINSRDSILDAIKKLDAGMSYKTLGFEFCSLTESSQLSDVNNSLKPSFSSLEDLYNYISKDGKIKIAYTQTSTDCKSDATSSYYSTNNGDGSYMRMITISSTCMKFAQNEFGGIIKIQYTVKSGSISSVAVAKKQF